MKKFGIVFLVVVLIFSLSAPCLTVFSATNAVQISMSCVGSAILGEEMTLKITVGKPSQKLAGLEFALDFDSNFVTPTITTNNENGTEMSKLIKKMPSGWEQLSSYSKAENRYYFRFAMPEGGSYLTADGQIVIEIPFKVNKVGSISFTIPNSEIIAVAGDSKLSLLSGKGGSFSTVSTETGDRFSVDITNKGSANENGLYYINLTVTNIGSADGIIAVEFALRYNPTYFEPYITQNDTQQMNSFMVSMPKGSWEQMCTLYESENRYILRFSALHAESSTDCEKLEKGKSMKISVPFKVVGKEGWAAAFRVDSTTAIGLDNAMKKVTGSGDSQTIPIRQRTSFVPQWIYKTNAGYVYAPPKTKISDFLDPLNENAAHVANNGKKVTDGLIKTGYTLVNGSESLTIIVKGDADNDGIVTSMDYVYVKRAFFKQYTFKGLLFYAAALTNGKSIVSMDYLMIKRNFFGQYKF